MGLVCVGILLLLVERFFLCVLFLGWNECGIIAGNGFAVDGGGGGALLIDRLSAICMCSFRVCGHSDDV